jgi:hypothetical protein
MLTSVKQSLAIRTIVRVQGRMNIPGNHIGQKIGKNPGGGLACLVRLPCSMKMMP